MTALPRRSVSSRLAGYEDINDAERLSVDPAMRQVVGGRARGARAASTSQMGRVETEELTPTGNLAALMDHPAAWIDRVQQRRSTDRIILDLDSSVRQTHDQREGSAHNGYFGCTCDHPLFCFTQHGDLERALLHCGNVAGADERRSVLEPVIAGDRHRTGKFTRYFQGDAGFAHPEVYEFLGPRATCASSGAPPTRTTSRYTRARWPTVVVGGRSVGKSRITAVLLSFVIPAHNEAACLGATIDAIRNAASGLSHEIIVADDASTDTTPEIAASRGARVVRHERRQIAATRNLGARAATGDVFIFVDADTLVTPAVLRESLDMLASGCVGGGAFRDFDGVVPLHARLLMKPLLNVFRILNTCGGAYMFCTRGAFDTSGGWDESRYAGEELYFVRALKRRGRFRLVRSRVVTSARKLRTHSAWEIYSFMLRALVTGPRIVRDRTHLDLWYGPRREDPGA